AESFLHSVRPDLTRDISHLVQTVADGLQAAPTALIHGDLKPGHILVDGKRVTLIDFDLMRAADPVADIAHLVAFLGKPQDRAQSHDGQAESAADIFVEEYFARVPEAWRSRLPLYHAMTSIHKAVGLCRRRGSEGQGRVEGVLREGQALLSGDGDGSIPSYKRRLTRIAVRRGERVS
ncbi:MAG: phosphotransferase family protein, partial [Thermomicrobiales bacterium]